MNKINQNSTGHIKKIIGMVQNIGLRENNYGLMNGNTGLCVFYYHLFRNTNNTEYEQLADDLLDKIFANLSISAYSDFENGLAGIGWGVEYLVQNGFAEGDTDEILEEVDNKVFKALHEDRPLSFELTDGLTGYLFYLISRLKKPKNPDSIAQYINRELLILIINKLDVLVVNQFPSIMKEMYFDLFWRFPVMFYGLAQALELDIYNEKIRCMIKQWLPSIEAYIPSMHINRLYLATVLTQVNTNLSNKRLEKHIQILLFATDFEALKAEVNPNALNIRYGWPGIAWLLKKASGIIPSNYPNYQQIENTYREITDKHKITLENLQLINAHTNPKLFGLSEGVTGTGLMELLWPEVLTKTHNIKILNK